MIDLDKAEALLRSEGLSPWRPSLASVRAYTSDALLAEVVVRSHRACVCPVFECSGLDEVPPDEADALAGALTRAAHICRRIEAECQKDAKGD